MRLYVFVTLCVGLVASQCAEKPEPVVPLELNATLPVGFASPGFNYSDPDSRYPDNIRCEWLITNYDPNQEIEIGFANFSLETCTQCDCDYLKIYSGDQPLEENLLKTLCTSIKPDAVRPGPNVTQMYVVFDTNGYTTDNVGFLARAGFPIDSYACDPDKQPEIINSPKPGFFYTRDYPSNYGNNMRCSWKFEAPESQRILVSFYDFQVEDCCSCDYMEVFNGPSDQDRRMGRWFGEYLPAVMTSATSDMFMTFRTDSSLRLPGYFGFYKFVE